MKHLGFAASVTFVLLAAGSLARADTLFVTVVAPSGTITVSPGQTVQIPISFNYSNAGNQPMDNFDLALNYNASALSLSSTGDFVEWAPGSSLTPSFNYLYPNWSLTPNAANGHFSAAALRSPWINNAAALGTLPTLDLFVNVNANAPAGLTQVSLSGIYPPYFDLDGGIRLSSNTISLNVVPEPASFALLLAALIVGGGLLVARRWRGS